jgi:hypothetical protein
MKQIGIILIILGLGLSLFSTYTYFTREKVVDAGPIQVTRDEPHTISWSPIVGVLLIGIGGVVLFQSTRKS